jgi:hypothetical protein
MEKSGEDWNCVWLHAVKTVVQTVEGRALMSGTGQGMRTWLDAETDRRPPFAWVLHANQLQKAYMFLAEVKAAETSAANYEAAFDKAAPKGQTSTQQHVLRFAQSCFCTSPEPVVATSRMQSRDR